jgi:hypothetical protein
MFNRHLNPGGYIEVTDISFPIRMDDAVFPPDSALEKWGNLMLESAKNIGRPSNSAESYKSQLVAAGFEKVVETQYKWPQNDWPVDPKLKEMGLLYFTVSCLCRLSHVELELVLQKLTGNIGMYALVDFENCLEGISMRLFTLGLDWTALEVNMFCVEVRKEMKNRRIHAYYPM